MTISCASCRVAGICSLQPSRAMMEASGPRASHSQAFQTQRCCSLTSVSTLRIVHAILLLEGTPLFCWRIAADSWMHKLKRDHLPVIKVAYKQENMSPPGFDVQVVCLPSLPQ